MLAFGAFENQDENQDENEDEDEDENEAEENGLRHYGVAQGAQAG